MTLTSRTGKTLTPAYPELVEALDAEPATEFLADGEIVAFEGFVPASGGCRGGWGSRIRGWRG